MWNFQDTFKTRDDLLVLFKLNGYTLKTLFKWWWDLSANGIFLIMKSLKKYVMC